MNGTCRALGRPWWPAATGLRIGGPVGGLLGALVGYAAPDLWRKKEKIKAFVSFDFDNDRALRDFLVGQAHNPDSPFEVIDHSLKEAAPERNWLEKARHAIALSDVVVIMLGSKTRYAQGVLKEVQIANDLNKRRFQIIGYANGSEDWKIPNGGRVYRWNWGNLKKLFG